MEKTKQTIAYKTSDGKLFEVKQKANEHQRLLNLRYEIDNWCDTYCFSGMTTTDIADAIFEHIDDLVFIRRK